MAEKESSKIIGRSKCFSECTGCEKPTNTDVKIVNGKKELICSSCGYVGKPEPKGELIRFSS